MPTHIVFLVHGMGRQLDDPTQPDKSWHAVLTKQLDQAWRGFDALKSRRREDYVEFVPISYDRVFRDYLKGVANHASAISKVVPENKAQEFFDALGKAGEDENFFWDDVVDVLLYRYGADLYRNLHVAVQKTIAESVIKHWDLQGTLDTKFSMISHSLGTAIAHGALNRLGGGKLSTSSAFRLGGPFFLRTYMTLANVSRVLWWGEHELYGSTIVRPPAENVQGYTNRFLNVRHIVDPFPMPKRFFPTEWGPAFADVTVRHLQDLNVHAYEHYLANPRITGLFFQSLVGKALLPNDSIERACAAPAFVELSLVPEARKQALANVRDALANEMREAFAGDAGIVPSVARLLGRAAKLAWRTRVELKALLGT